MGGERGRSRLSVRRMGMGCLTTKAQDTQDTVLEEEKESRNATQRGSNERFLSEVAKRKKSGLPEILSEGITSKL